MEEKPNGVMERGAKNDETLATWDEVTTEVQEECIVDENEVPYDDALGLESQIPEVDATPPAAASPSAPPSGPERRTCIARRHRAKESEVLEDDSDKWSDLDDLSGTKSVLPRMMRVKRAKHE